jgi:hypothetical protein
MLGRLSAGPGGRPSRRRPRAPRAHRVADGRLVRHLATPAAMRAGGVRTGTQPPQPRELHDQGADDRGDCSQRSALSSHENGGSPRKAVSGSRCGRSPRPRTADRRPPSRPSSRRTRLPKRDIRGGCQARTRSRCFTRSGGDSRFGKEARRWRRLSQPGRPPRAPGKPDLSKLARSGRVTVQI